MTKFILVEFSGDNMRIRTITNGISIESVDDKKFQDASKFIKNAKDCFEEQGYEVETIRISTNSFEQYIKGAQLSDILDEFRHLNSICSELGVEFLSIGEARNPDTINILADILKLSTVFNSPGLIGDAKSGISFKNIKESAKVIKRLSEETEGGLGNFQFCASANCKPGIPFFPAGYHLGETSFAIGLECSDFLMRAFSEADCFEEAAEKLKQVVESELSAIEKIAKEISKEFDVKYAGIDASIASSLAANESVAFAFEKLGFGKFGCQGTLAISAMITQVLKNLTVKTCGYSGLMLPVCEDAGLAQRANENTYNLSNLLLYSSVCGCGFDTVPIPGDTTEEQIGAMLLDVASLAIKLDKQLAARLFPVPGKKAGEMSEFDSPYLVNCRIFDVD